MESSLGDRCGVAISYGSLGGQPISRMQSLPASFDGPSNAFSAVGTERGKKQKRGHHGTSPEPSALRAMELGLAPERKQAAEAEAAAATEAMEYERSRRGGGEGVSTLSLSRKNSL